MFVISRKKEGELMMSGGRHMGVQMFSLKHASVKSRMCIHGMQNTRYNRVYISHQRDEVCDCYRL